MGQIDVKRDIQASATSVWQELADFGDLAGWMPGVQKCEVKGSGIGAVRRRILHRRVADAMTAQYSAAQQNSAGNLDSGQIAFHYELAGSLDQAVRYYIRAGDYIAHFHAYYRAEQLYEHAQKIAARLNLPAETLTQIYTERGRMLELAEQHDAAGHAGFTRQVVDAAIARHARSSRPWEVRPRPAGDHGLFATRRIEPGERIVAFEERPHHLVTSSYVEAAWGEPHRSWFDLYAWPLTDEVWVTWSRSPEEWMPVNHACEPTAWLSGLDVVARVALERGDEVTLDYATFYNERMPAFECSCGAPSCRRVVRGTDHLEPFVARYGEHVSDYVRRKRART